MRINSLLSAEGWWCAFQGEVGDPSFRRLVAFAVVETGEQSQTLQGYAVYGLELDTVEDDDTFAGYFHDSDFVVRGAELTPSATARLKGRD